MNTPVSLNTTTANSSHVKITAGGYRPYLQFLRSWESPIPEMVTGVGEDMPVLEVMINDTVKH